jgi:hypothetical protein
MKTLADLVERESFDVPAALAFDHFQRRILEGLHLEFFLAQGRLILTPHLSPLTTAPASPDEEERLDAILGAKQDLIEQLKIYLLYVLSFHSAVLEANSYFIAVNDYRVICRVLARAPELCEVKLYTQPPGDPLEHYGDRIYLGRAGLPLDSPRLPHLGLGFLRRSLPEQLARLEARMEKHATRAERAEFEKSFRADLVEAIEEFTAQADHALRSYPPNLSSRTLPAGVLLRVNRDFREIKHALMDAEMVVHELEDRMLAAGSEAARYVTKLRKDLTNDIAYVQVKVNGRISDVVNGIRL